MRVAVLDSPSLVFALAMLVGVVAQAAARHVLIPGIVVLLGAGILLGPDVADVIRRSALGSAQSSIVGFAVAIIMFEGGMRLDLVQLRKQAKVIRRLVVLGAAITAAGATLACHVIMGWDVRLSALFGTLVVVTGPTVVGPLVRRIRLAPSLATILEAEGVFIDAVGAMIAIMALEIATAPSTGEIGDAALGVAKRLGVGITIGVAGGLAIGSLLRVPRVMPRGIENIFALAGAVVLYELSHALVRDSGIPAAMIAGLVVGNMRVHRMSELVEFKEQLTVLLIGTLFVLLAADVRMADVVALGWPALAVVAALSLVVRPLEVLACTVRTGLGAREKLYLGWVAPRGIVAAAVASLFADALGDANIAGGVALRALVFTVIAVTVTLQGLSAGPLAALLGLRRATNNGYVLLGASPIARYLGRRLGEAGEAVELIDYDTDDCRAAEEMGLKVIHGNGLENRTLARSRVEARTHALALTSNEGVNLLFAQCVVEDFYGPRVLAALDPRDIGVSAQMLESRGIGVLFGRPADLASWIARWDRGRVAVIRRTRVGEPTDLADLPDALLPLVVEHAGKLRVVDDTTRVHPDEVVDFALAIDRREHADPWLDAGGWVEVATAVEEPRAHVAAAGVAAVSHT